MVEAISTLDEPLSQAIPWSMVKLETLRLARNWVKEDIRAKGLRLKDYEAKDITKLAELWFSKYRLCSSPKLGRQSPQLGFCE